VVITSESYERMKLVYNCCFVVMKARMPAQETEDRFQFFLEKNCEKLAIYLMEFEQKYQIISNPANKEDLHNILTTIYDNISRDKKSTMRIFEDIICLDLMANYLKMPLEAWKRKFKHRIPFLM